MDLNALESPAGGYTVAWHKNYSVEELSVSHITDLKYLKPHCCSTIPFLLKHMRISDELVMRLRFSVNDSPQMDKVLSSNAWDAGAATTSSRSMVLGTDTLLQVALQEGRMIRTVCQSNLQVE